ncbi:MAG: response regulator transcription factor [Caldilineaceae bacterium]|nr:response regulator transcription factor [Caldilineaceae bacterium]
MKPIRVLLVDDHPVVRAGIEGILNSQTDIEVVGEASDGIEAICLNQTLQPDVILMDLQMPKMDGVTAIKAIHEQANPPHILVLTTYDTDADIAQAIQAGATGYLLKDTPREDFFAAVRQVAQGKSVLTPVVASRLMAHMRAPAEEQLSGREVEVLTLVSQGHSNKDIAKQLHISTATVKTHLIHIYGKLGVSDRTAAVTTALEKGILRLKG